MIAVQMGVDDAIQWSAVKRCLNQEKCLVSMCAVASINDCSLLA